MLRQCLVLLVLLLGALPAEAQSGGWQCTGCVEMDFLRISPSPRQNAMGAVGTALPVKDAFGFFYNPAQLGYFGQTANVAVHGYPRAVDWLSTGTDWSSTAVSLGYDLKPTTGVPLAIGMGFMAAEMDYGVFENVVVRDPTSPSGFRRLENPVPGPRNEYNALGVGVGFDAGIGVHAGVTYKRPSARPSPLVLLSRGEEVEEPLPNPDPVQTSAVDVGVMVTLPLSDTLVDLLPLSAPFTPFARVALGYAADGLSQSDPSDGAAWV